MGRINERIAEMAARAPDRFVGLGSVPLQAPTRSDRPPALLRDTANGQTTVFLRGVAKPESRAG